ncbi:hypothetical protein B4168_0016 [Anoxybacillus flavithermus]|nr:hypothetical protein B4168_0016 [Anoxybacillus flavithermus]OAO88165.1 hypothetical protein GT23_0584 [Parageobacillus thermoglucosidasius]
MQLNKSFARVLDNKEMGSSLYSFFGQHLPFFVLYSIDEAVA